jgi:3-hydroxyisobutyrate dehydrogenase
MRIGIAGIGKMGAAIAARLSESGEEVLVWNRTRSRAEATGSTVVDTPRELAERSDVILSTLFDACAVQAVYHEQDGLLASAAGKLFVEMSTVRPHEQQSLADSVRKAGGAFVECPVGGTTGPARAGQLLGLLGGEAVDVARALPLLRKLCSRIEHMGPVGAGASTKLAINLPLIVFWQSFAEALALLRQSGKDPHWLVQLFSETAGGPNVLKVKGKSVAMALSGNQPVEPTFDIDAMRKDLRAMLDEGQTNGISLPLAAQALAVFNEASAAGIGKQDCSTMPAYWVNKV